MTFSGLLIFVLASLCLFSVCSKPIGKFKRGCVLLTTVAKIIMS